MHWLWRLLCGCLSATSSSSLAGKTGRFLLCDCQLNLATICRQRCYRAC